MLLPQATSIIASITTSITSLCWEQFSAMELAIDTSTNIVAIALSQRGEILALLSWHTGQNHTIELMPNLISLLRQAKVELSSAEAIFVAKGPGSFNGLRAGIGAAKGLALALGIPLLGISTLETEAYLFAPIGLPIRAIHKAGRREIATALYQQKDGKWQCLETESITTVETLCRRTKRRTIFCGEIPADILTEIRQKLDKRAIIAAGIAMPRVFSLAILGWLRFGQGKQDDSVTLQPLYLRPPHITMPKERRPVFTL